MPKIRDYIIRSKDGFFFYCPECNELHFYSGYPYCYDYDINNFTLDDCVYVLKAPANDSFSDIKCYSEKSFAPNIKCYLTIAGGKITYHKFENGIVSVIFVRPMIPIKEAVEKMKLCSFYDS
jgi:hypothetical protein